jgi:hypothetical protein
MLIRHAEKPDGKGVFGVSAVGQVDARELSVRGWQRAGALLALFSPSMVRPPLAVPTAMFASRPSPSSIRPLHTVDLLAQTLSMNVDVSYGNKEESDLVSSALVSDDVVLISWKHDGLPTIGRLIVGDSIPVPSDWPQDRFDLVWIFDRPSGGGRWTFTQAAQLLLPGDRAELITLAK